MGEIKLEENVNAYAFSQIVWDILSFLLDKKPNCFKKLNTKNLHKN